MFNNRVRQIAVLTAGVLIDTCAAAAWVPLVMTSGAAIVTLVFGEDSVSPGAWI
jgi:hypothetical protein